MFLVRTFQKISEGGPYYVLFSTNLLLISVLYCYIAKCLIFIIKTMFLKKIQKKFGESMWNVFIDDSLKCLISFVQRNNLMT